MDHNFENKMLYYKLIPKTCRANTSLENYNRYLKENLDYPQSPIPNIFIKY